MKKGSESSPCFVGKGEPMEKYLNVLRNELHRASWDFYAHITINKEAANNKKIYFALYAEAGLWNAINSAFVTDFFVVLGRIFDTDKRSLSIFKLMDKCRENIDQFSLSALRNRKVNSSANSSEWINDYMADRYSPTKSDFDDLGEVVCRSYCDYYDIYRMMRNKRVAHADEDAILGNKRIDGPLIEDVKNLLNDIYGIYCVVDQYYTNGRKTLISDHKYDEERYVNKDVRNLLRKLTKE